WLDAVVLLFPPLVAYAFICLSAWYVCRAMPLATSGVPHVLATSGLAALVAGGIWIGLTEGWMATLGSAQSFDPAILQFRQQTPFLVSAAVLLFLLVISVHYVVLAFEAIRDAEHQQL